MQALTWRTVGSPAKIPRTAMLSILRFLVLLFFWGLRSYLKPNATAATDGNID